MVGQRLLRCRALAQRRDNSRPFPLALGYQLGKPALGHELVARA